jgi:nitrous oxidase accessory protein
VQPVIGIWLRDPAARKLSAGLLALLLGIVASCPAAAVVRLVEAGGTHLAEAIAISKHGDVLNLSPGVHQGPVTVDRPITLMSEGGAVIDGGGRGSVVTVSAPDVVIRSLVIRNSGAKLADQDSGIFVDKAGDRTLIEENQLEGNLIGIYLWGPERAVARNNQITGRSDLRVSERGNGIQLWNTPGSVVEGNEVRFGRDGIFVTTSKENSFRNNTFRDLRFAIHYMYTNDSEVSGNISIGNHVGYAIMFSHRLIVRDNLSDGDRDRGLLLNYANSSLIEGNLVRGAKKCLFIYNANKNRIFGNRFEDCDIGIHFTAGSEDNDITGNAFIDNRTQVKYVGTRYVEWSADGRGNYWSDNPAFDLNGDGIADRPYRPNDLVDQVVWRHPQAKLLLNSPAVQVLRWAQSEFPSLHPGGVTDSAPLLSSDGIAGAKAH